MKYYLAIDSEGRKQLRDTQDEIRKVSKTFEQIDLPTDKTGLRELVQESFDHIFNLETQISSVATAEEPEVPAEQVASDQSQPQANSKPPVRPLSPVASASFEATDIEDFILNRASICHVENIYSCLGARFAELIQKSKEHSND